MTMHTFKAGAVVTVFNQTLSGKFFAEGRALVLRRIADTDEQYRVRFEKSGDEVERFVDPAGQEDPAAFVKRLNGEKQ